MAVVGSWQWANAQPIPTKHVFDNGLTALITEMPTSPVVCVYVLVKTGSASEAEFLGSGISHFTEHMLFKGTDTRGVGEIPAQIQAIGGTINASTGKDYTIYTVTVPAESFDTGLAVISDMVMHAKFDPAEVARERDVIISEIQLYNDKPEHRLSDRVYQQVYMRHPYRHPVIGYESVFRGISRDDLVKYYTQRYAPNNMVLSIAGNVAGAEILPKLHAAFDGATRQREVPRNLPQELPQLSPRRYAEPYATDMTHVSMSFSSVPLLHPDLYALDVLAMIIGQGQSSRFYQEIYKKTTLVQSISAGNYTPIDRGVFEIEMILDQYENVAPASVAVWEQIRRLQQKGVSSEELQRAQRQVQSEYIRSNQTSAAVAYSQAVDEAFSGDPHFSARYVDGVKAVTRADIKRVARQYLIPQTETQVVIYPEGADDSQAAATAGSADRGEVQRYVLDNGITILLREDHSFPLVSIRSFFTGGFRADPPSLEGIFSILTQVWTRGTARQSSEELAARSESRGISYGAFSGVNSFGLSITALSEDSDFAMALFDETIAQPVFPQNEIDKIKEQLHTSIKARRDNISRFAVCELKQELFQTHPYRNEGIGTDETIDRITRQDILDLYKRSVVPSNMVVTVFGDIDPVAVKAQLQQYLGRLTGPPVVPHTFAEAAISAQRKKIVPLDKQQSMVVMGFHGVTVYDADRYGLEVLTALLGSSFKGRLFSHIREEKGYAYSVGGSFTPGIDAGHVLLYALTKPAHAEAVVDLIAAEVADIAARGVSAVELADIKMYLKGSFKRGNETNDALSWTVGLDELYGLGALRYIEYDARIDAVTNEDIQRLARGILDPTRSVVVTVAPSSVEQMK